MAVTLANWTKRRRLEKALEVTIDGHFSWTPELEIILRACTNLEELCIGSEMFEVPLNVLQYSSLKSSAPTFQFFPNQLLLLHCGCRTKKTGCVLLVPSIFNFHPKLAKYSTGGTRSTPISFSHNR